MRIHTQSNTQQSTTSTKLEHNSDIAHTNDCLDDTEFIIMVRLVKAVSHHICRRHLWVI